VFITALTSVIKGSSIGESNSPEHVVIDPTFLKINHE
jgi:hypothetical protein